jgi:hypothetical protein
MVQVVFDISESDADGLAELVKRLSRRNLGRDDLNLVTPEEEAGAEAGLYALRQALAKAGFDPR